jgi:hypothetical protein
MTTDDGRWIPTSRGFAFADTVARAGLEALDDRIGPGG